MYKPNTQGEDPSMATAELTVTGYASGDPEITSTKSGIPKATIVVPYTPQKWNNETKRWEDTGATVWYRAVFWRENANAIANLGIHKGSSVTLIGTPSVEAYIDKEGNPAASVQLNNAKVFVDHTPRRSSGNKGNNNNGGGQQYQQAQQGYQQNAPQQGWGQQQGYQQGAPQQGWGQQGAPQQAAWGNDNTPPF